MSSAIEEPFGLTMCGPFVELCEPIDVEADDLSLSGLSEDACGSAFCKPLALWEEGEADEAGCFHGLFIMDHPALGKSIQDLPSKHPESHTVELLCTLNSTRWREPKVQKMALLATGQIYAGYRKWRGSCDRWSYYDERSSGAGVVLLRDWRCLLSFVGGQLVHQQWLNWAARGAIFLGARLHGMRRVEQLNEEMIRNSLSTVALGWKLHEFCVGKQMPHITLAWTLGKSSNHSANSAFVPKSCVRLPEPLTFFITSKWISGGGYDLSASRAVSECIDVARFPPRNDGGSPGSSEWWHISGTHPRLDELWEKGVALPGEFGLKTLEFYWAKRKGVFCSFGIHARKHQSSGWFACARGKCEQTHVKGSWSATIWIRAKRLTNKAGWWQKPSVFA